MDGSYTDLTLGLSWNRVPLPSMSSLLSSLFYNYLLFGGLFLGPFLPAILFYLTFLFLLFISSHFGGIFGRASLAGLIGAASSIPKEAYSALSPHVSTA